MYIQCVYNVYMYMYMCIYIIHMCMHVHVHVHLGEYMLRDCSDSEDSFSGDDEPHPTTASDRPPSELIPTSEASVSITGDAPPSAPANEMKGEEADNEESQEEDEDKGDPEMAPVFLKKMLPVFTELFHSSLAPPLR